MGIEPMHMVPQTNALPLSYTQILANGLEPLFLKSKSNVLPLNYTRKDHSCRIVFLKEKKKIENVTHGITFFKKLKKTIKCH